MQIIFVFKIGHSVQKKTKPVLGRTHHWRCYVDSWNPLYPLSAFVKKVTFKLHDTFDNPKQVVRYPPFAIEEDGFGTFQLQIEIAFLDCCSTFYYDLTLFDNNALHTYRTVRLDPAPVDWNKLVQFGGIVIPRTCGQYQVHEIVHTIQTSSKLENLHPYSFYPELKCNSENSNQTSSKSTINVSDFDPAQSSCLGDKDEIRSMDGRHVNESETSLNSVSDRLFLTQPLPQKHKKKLQLLHEAQLLLEKAQQQKQNWSAVLPSPVCGSPIHDHAHNLSPNPSSCSSRMSTKDISNSNSNSNNNMDHHFNGYKRSSPLSFDNKSSTKDSPKSDHPKTMDESKDGSPMKQRIILKLSRSACNNQLIVSNAPQLDDDNNTVSKKQKRKMKSDNSSTSHKSARKSLETTAHSSISPQASNKICNTQEKNMESREFSSSRFKKHHDKHEKLDKTSSNNASLFVGNFLSDNNYSADKSDNEEDNQQQRSNVFGDKSTINDSKSINADLCLSDSNLLSPNNYLINDQNDFDNPVDLDINQYSKDYFGQHSCTTPPHKITLKPLPTNEDRSKQTVNPLNKQLFDLDRVSESKFMEKSNDFVYDEDFDDNQTHSKTLMLSASPEDNGDRVPSDCFPNNSYNKDKATANYHYYSKDKRSQCSSEGDCGFRDFDQETTTFDLKKKFSKKKHKKHKHSSNDHISSSTEKKQEPVNIVNNDKHCKPSPNKHATLPLDEGKKHAKDATSKTESNLKTNDKCFNKSKSKPKSNQFMTNTEATDIDCSSNEQGSKLTTIGNESSTENKSKFTHSDQSSEKFKKNKDMLVTIQSNSLHGTSRLSPGPFNAATPSSISSSSSATPPMQSDGLDYSFADKTQQNNNKNTSIAGTTTITTITNKIKPPNLHKQSHKSSDNPVKINSEKPADTDSPVNKASYKQLQSTPDKNLSSKYSSHKLEILFDRLIRLNEPQLAIRMSEILLEYVITESPRNSKTDSEPERKAGNKSISKSTTSNSVSNITSNNHNNHNLNKSVKVLHDEPKLIAFDLRKLPYTCLDRLVELIREDEELFKLQNASNEIIACTKSVPNNKIVINANQKSTIID